MADISREEALEHFGVRGMHWGVRNAKSSSGSKKATVLATLAKADPRNMSSGQKQAVIGLSITGASIATTLLLSPIGGMSVAAVGRAASVAFQTQTIDRSGPAVFKEIH